MNTIPTPAGPIAIGGDDPTTQLVVLVDSVAPYDWGAVAATLGQRPKFIRMNAGGARVIVMPAEALCAGWDVYVHNTNAGNSIALQNDATGAIGAGTIAGSSVGHYYCDGVTWYDLGEVAEL